MQYFFIENKISDSQEGAKLCLSSIFPDGEDTIDRNSNFHARTVAPRTLPFFQIKDPIPCCRAGLSINIS